MRAGYCRITNIGNEDLLAVMIIGKPVWADTDRNLRHLRVTTGREDADCVLNPIGGDDELRFVAHQDSGNAGQLRNREQVRSGGKTNQWSDVTCISLVLWSICSITRTYRLFDIYRGLSAASEIV